MNVLVIVDVQNCFMYNSDENKPSINLNVAEEQVSNEIISELEILAKKSDVVVFSRDFHPLNHISIEGSEGRSFSPPNVWPAHCRNRRIKCKSRLQETTVDVEQQQSAKNHIVNTETGELFEYGTDQWNANKSKPNFIYVIGTDLSHAFFKNKLFKDPVKRLVVANKTGRYKIGLTTTRMEYVDDNYKLLTIDPAQQGTPDTSNAPLTTVDGKKYIALTKGERCNDEAFSAFNYHINYDPANAAKPEAVPIPPTDKSKSTGLWEWILLNNKKENTEITITVCGLVGNVCVMHSLLQGIALWNNLYSKDLANADIKVKFVYSLCGTRFAAVLPPTEVKPVIGDDFRSEIVDWFNLNKPSGLWKITVKKLVDAAGCVPEHAINNFEILNYDGAPKFIGAFSPTVAEYSAEILKLNNGFATKLQTTGGFSLPANITKTELKYLKVENIYRRLGVLATDNLVAVSECVKNESDPKSVVTAVLRESKSTIFGCENDTGFIMHPTTTQEDSNFTVDEQIVQKNTTPAENGTTRVLTIKIPESREIKIASIHLPGDGPGPKSKLISAFLTENLKHIRDTGVQVICGDTNITDNKVMPNEKQTRLDEIANYFYGFFGNAPCLILSSNVPVIKHRRGFILRNQQLKKSVPESETSAESDGTIIAIKLGPSITADAIIPAIESIDLNCVAKLGPDSPPETIKSQSKSDSVAALNFKTAIERCIDPADGHPMEPIWLDHSLLHIKMQTLGTLLGITIPPKFPRNLIVANMGSIVNAGGKNWNTTYIPNQLEINKTDRAIYEIIRSNQGTATPETLLPEYADITGSTMIKSDSGPKLGVDEITINVSDDITTNITAELTKLQQMLNSSVTQGTQGGGGRRRLRFTARPRHKSKSKSKSKSKFKAKSRKIRKNRKMSRSIKPKSRKS